ncbi:MAG: 50S ribosomal protein L11 methyltransferase [Alphaproteobacteria bacterium]|jgi:ribosomal protein L11 methyltransferase
MKISKNNNQIVRIHFIENEKNTELIENEILDKKLDILSIARYEEINTWNIEILVNKDFKLEELNKILIDAIHYTPIININNIENIDWVSESLKNLKPLSIDRFYIYNSYYKNINKPEKINIKIDASNAFGSGHHYSTIGCLESMAFLKKFKKFKNILDIGTGTGILIIAAARLWKSKCLATDIDPIAKDISKNNIKINNTSSFTKVLEAKPLNHQTIRSKGHFDLIVINILANSINKIVNEVNILTERNSYVILSGIKKTQRAKVIAKWNKFNFYPLKMFSYGNWITLILKKN